MDREDQFQLNEAREAKAHRDKAGRSDAKADRVLEYYEAGVFDLFGKGITNPMVQTPAEWLAEHGKPLGEPTRNPVAGDADTGEDRFTGRRGGEPASNQFGTFEVHQASDAQVRFLRNLIAQKDTASAATSKLGPIVVPDNIEGISKKSASALIDRLMGCPDKAATAEVNGTAGGPLVSDKQMGFLRKLIAERDYYSLSVKDRGYVDAVNDGKVPTKRGASALIDVLTTTAFAAGDGTGRGVSRTDTGVAASAAGALEPGMYRTADGTIYKVYPAQNGGHLLAKRVELIEDWTFETHGKNKANLVYAGAAGRFVTAADRMSLDEAKDYGRAYAFCCVCGAYLENEESVALGIGPVCGGRV